MEWVAPDRFARWSPPKVTVEEMVSAYRTGSKYRKDKDESKSKGKGKAEVRTPNRTPLAIEGRAPRGNYGDQGPGGPRPHGGPGPAGAIGARRPLGNPGDEGPGGPRAQGGKKAIGSQPEAVRLPYGERTVAQQQASQEALGAMVRDVLSKRQHALGPGAERNTAGLTIHTGELVSDESRTKPLDMRTRSVGPGRTPLAVGTTRDKAATGPIRLGDTQEFPKSVNDKTREFRLAKGITQRAEPLGQMSMFDVPRERESHNFLSAREAHTERIARIPTGMAPGRQVASFAARPYFPKGEDQGSLLQPRKYR